MNCRKIISKGCILDTKLVKKAVIYFKIFFIILVILRDTLLYIKIVVLRPKCRTKFLAFAGKPYSIGISANGEI